MRSVVMVAHDFPPEGSAGAYRPLRFVRHLPAMGWEPSVISAETRSYERYDPELLRQVPHATEIVRVASRDPWQAIQDRRRARSQRSSVSPDIAARPRRTGFSIRSILREAVRRLEAWCYHPDMAMGWIYPAIEATVAMATRKKADVIWATAGPISSFFVAERASIRTGLPYVLDFRDAWTITHNDFDVRRPGWAVRADRRGLRRLLSGAQAIVFRYQTEAECYWRAYPGAFSPSKVHIIPNGFDGTLDETPIPEPGHRCTIMYGGTLSSYRYDTLLQALELLKKTDEACVHQLQVLFVGEGTEVLAGEVAARGLSPIVQTSGPVSHGEVVRLQQQAHALLVLGRPPVMKGYELFAGAKLFGYLKAGRPIIGVLPPDETKRILRRVGVTTIADADAVEEIVAVLQRVVHAWAAGTLPALVPDRSACQSFSAERQTASLVRALECGVAAEPFVPNTVDVPASLSSSLSRMTSDRSPVYS